MTPYIRITDELDALENRLVFNTWNVAVNVACKDSQAVLSRVEELVQCVLTEAYNQQNENVDTALTIVAAKLPEWFPNALEHRFAGKWDVLDWVYWFLPSEDLRKWRWCGSEVISELEFKILLHAESLPFAWESLRVASICAGGTTAELGA